MTEVKEINAPVKIGNAKHLTATKMGKKHITILQPNGKHLDVTLDDYKYVPGLWVNLFAVMKALQNNWNIGNKGIK